MSWWVILLGLALALWSGMLTVDVSVDWKINTGHNQAEVVDDAITEQHTGNNREKLTAASAVVQRRFDIQRIDASAPDFDYVKIIRQGVPVILTNAPVKNWDALKLWNPTYLEENLRKVLHEARISRNPVFTTAAVKPGQLAPPETMRNEYLVVNTTIQELLKIHKNEPELFIYWAGTVSHWDQAIRQDIEPNNFLKISDQSAIGMWLSTPGVVANTHYDRSDNFHVMVTGRKKFIMFAPASHRGLYIYPSIHPHYHQSQIDITDKESLVKFPMFASQVALEFTLEQAEILYIPPYWGHRVESLDFSVSASFLAPSLHESICGRAMWTPLPFKNDWPLFKRTAAALIALETISMHVFNQSSSYIVNDILLNSRYHIMRDTLLKKAKVLDYFVRNRCYKDSISAESIPIRGDEKYASEIHDFIGSIELDVLQSLENSIEDWKTLPKYISEICIANFAEEVIKWAVGSADVISFITLCS